ncbi:MAG: DUF4143 domain-containing protein [Deltaproteobacteria bacterium]|nr:DUF4143 domain-containing protein [Deltaproteobacteria bacterium]
MVVANSLHAQEFKSQLFENLIYLDLRRAGYDVSYYLTKNGYEIDFVTTENGEPLDLFQACYSLDDPAVEFRESRALDQARQELSLQKGQIVTLDNYFAWVEALGLSDLSPG